VGGDNNEQMQHNFDNTDNDLAAFDSARFSHQSAGESGDGIVDVDFTQTPRMNIDQSHLLTSPLEAEIKKNEEVEETKD